MSSKDKKKNKLAQSSASWLGVKPGQLNKSIQTANKTVQQAQNQQNKTSAQAAKAAAPSSVSWRGTPASQIAKPTQQQMVTLPKITPGYVPASQRQQVATQQAVQKARTLAQNDNSMRARIARSHEAERQRLAANAAAIKQDKSRLASNSLLWHQTTDASRRRQLEQENAAIRTRRGFGYDARTGSTFDTKGNELSLGARMIYGGKAETAKQLPLVAQGREFARRGVSQPSIYDLVINGAKSDDPYYALENGRNAHGVINDLLNRSTDTWTDADTKARDKARTSLQNEMTALFEHYGKQYQPRWSAEQTAAALRNAGADEGTVAYAMENLRLRDSTDRLGQGLEAVGKRLEASVPSLVDTVKQAISNQSENKENEAFTRLEEQEKQLELQLQNMQSQDENGKVPADYQQVYDELQRVREEKNSLKVEKGVDQNLWSQKVLREANEAQANAEAGLAPAPRWVAEQAISLASNAPTMAASAVPFVGPALGSLVMGAQAAGQRAFELNEQGKSAGEALGRGTVSGIIEAATEKLPLERMAEILHSGGANAVKNILRQMGTEATEEGASYFLNYVSDLAAADPDAKFSLAELAQSAAGGAFGGLVFGAAGTVGAKLAQRNEGGIYDDTTYERDVVRSLQDADAQLRAARSLPEGAGREAAVNAAREKMSQTIADYTARYLAAHEEMNARNGLFGNPDGTANGFAGKKIPTYDELIEKPDVRVVDIRETPAGSYGEQRRNFMNSEEAQQLYRQPVTNYDTGEMVFVTPKTLEHSFSNGGQLQISAAKQIQQIIAHSVLTSAEPITHGDRNATGIYTLFGAVRTNDGVQPVKLKVKEYQLGNQQIPQNIAEYFNTYGVPEQYASAYDNKVLALESIEKEEASSSVQPTLAAKQTAQGEYPSASSLKDASSSAATMPFGVNDPSTSSYITVADLMGLVNGEARRYLPKENKSINQTLDGRLQLPGLLSDDTLAANSIRRNAGNSNTSDTNIPLSEAMQYGKTPEQAVMEANARAEGERVRQAREEQAAAEQQERLDRITNGKNRDILQRVYEAQERAERVASRHALERATTRATAADADSYIDHTQEDIAIDLVNSLESERRFLTNLRNGWHLSDAELVNAERMAAGRGPVTEMDSHRYELVETYARAMRQYNEDMQPYYAFQRGLDDARLRRATELIKDSDKWKDSRGNLGLQIRTPERVLRKVMGDTAETEAIYQAYFAPIFKHDAEAIRWENTQRERLKGIMEGLSHEDSVYMHMKNRAELSPKNEAMQKQLADYVKKNKSKIYFKQAESAMQKLYEMTSEMHPQVSEAGVRNGYAPLEFRQKYIPSLTPTKEGKWYNRILRKVGVETMVDELPTEIAGRTEDRRPGRQYAGFYNQREGINTEFDAFKAMDNYISGASNAIFHTDDIQNLRVLEDAIRSKYSDEGSRAELEAIRKDPDINIEDKEQKISKIWERNSGTLPSFPSWIAEYTNILAGKKSRTDRSAEQMFGRGLYRAMSDVEGKVAADMVGGNLSTAISNFIPLAQGSGEVRYSSMMRAMLDYGADLAKKNPAFHEDSDFLTNRRGSERVIKTKLQKASDAAGWTMNAIDNLSSEVMVRARYLDNVEKRHMSTEAALQEADRWAAGLIGDRAKGAKPVIMESKSPLIKVFTMFQLEVMNQYDHLFGDIPHNLRTQGRNKAQIAAGTAAALLQVFIMSHLFNDAREKLTGSRGAFDPIEMVNDFVGRLTGYALPNIFDLLGEMMGDGIDEDDFRAEKSETAWDNVKKTAQDIASNVPFVSGPLGAVFGAGNSRLPIQSVIPNIDNIMTAQGEEARSMALKKELSKPLYGFLLPFGGLQAKKTVEGAATMFAGGSYSYNKKGEKILQFPVYGQTPRDWAQAVLFGKSSLKTAQDWAENGYDTLNAKETKAFDTLRERMSWHRDENGNVADNSEAVFAAIKAMRAISDETDDRDIAAGKIREMLFNDSALSAGQKNFLDRELVNGGESGVYTSRDAFDISQTVREGRQLDAAEAVKHGITVSQFATWDNRLKTALDDNLVDAADYEEGGDNKLYAKNAVLSSILSDYMNNSGFTDAEKQAFADYVIISAMSKTERVTWNGEVKGKVNASDYVKFKGDLAAFKKEFKGTGVDTTASVQAILDSYTNLSDEQKSVLMHVYSDSAINDPFHVSSYEQALANNDYYKSLDESEKKKLRANCNEYEQAINENKELKGWKAKAYMAREAGIEPGTYALFQTALSLINADGGTPANDEITQAVKLVSGISDSQRAYLWQAAYGKDTTKNNPWGGAKVTKYQKRENEAVNPVEGGTISSGFGWRQSFQTSGGQSSNDHKAIDIAAPAGTAVKAAMSGKITLVYKGDYGGYGNTVEIDHGNGIITKYHHMQDGSLEGLSVGQEVKAGQQIGKVGSTGKSTGPHLDFQVQKDGNFVDPRNYIPGYGEGTSATISAAQAAAAAAKESRKSSGGSKGKSSGGSSGLRKPSAPKGLSVFR